MAPTERRWLEAAALLLALVAISPDSFPSAQAQNRCDLVSDFSLCPCYSLGASSGLAVDCNSLSIMEITEALRASDTMRRRTESLSIIGGPNSELPNGTFDGLSSLQTLTISFQSQLREIEPGAFSSLPNLVLLDIRDNGLQWLSQDSFIGIGSRLTTLRIANNPLQNLRSDLEPFFNSLSTLVMNNLDDLVCDCHLRWLPHFINTASSRIGFSLDVRGTTCSDQGGVSITNSSVNFDLNICTDICTLGYHNCHPNATCTVVGGTNTSCTCNTGFVGDGFNCTDAPTTVLTCSDVICGPNAVCQTLNQLPQCVCNPGFEGHGSNCTMTCGGVMCGANAVCETANEFPRCVCSPGFVGDGFNCTMTCGGVICGSNAVCETANEFPQCVCNPGFVGDGLNCSMTCGGVICGTNAVCETANEFPRCVCSPGFVGNGINCTDPTATTCGSTDVVCDRNAVCIIVSEALQCVCKSGFVGDGSVCYRIDPCDSITCDPNAVCIADDSSQTASCMCNSGFTGDGSLCASLEACNATCLTIQASLHCVVLQNVIECTSERVQQLFTTLSDLESNPTRSGVSMFTQQLMEISNNLTYSGDILQVGNLLFGSVELLTQNPSLYQQSSYMDLVMVASDLLDIDNIQLWLDLNQTTAAEHITELFSALEMLAQGLFLQDPAQMDTSIVGDNIAIVVMRPDCESRNQSITISSNTLDPNSQNGESTLVLPVSVFGDSLEESCGDVGVIAIVYGGAGPDLISLQDEFIPKSNCTPTPAPKVHGQCEWYPEEPCPDLQVNSIIISAVAVKSTRNRTGVDELNTTALAEPIVITLQHKDATHVGPNCAFLNEQEVQMGNGRWLTEGCTVNENRSDSDTTVCECSHLTSFAILTSPAGPPAPNFALSVVSKIGLSISILCLVVTIILLFALRIKESKLHHIHRQLAIALCLAQLVFLIGVDRILVPSPDALCTTIAALLHYLFLSTFAWQLVEGVHLYLFIVRVFFNRKVIYAYYPLAWGIPLVVVAITLGVRFCDYGSQYTCWITNGNGTNWAFHGPVIAVILVNIVVMVMVMYVILRARKKRNDDTFLFCTLLHSSFVLLPILGITWVLGFFVIGDNVASVVIEWLFCLLNSIQGMMLFIVHCLMNRDVRAAFLKAIGCHEAAKKQESVRTHIRRSSTATSFQQLKRTFSITGRRRPSAGDVTSLQLSDSSHVGLGVFGIVAEPSLNGKMKPKTTIGMTNPGFMMEEIEEEGSSIGSSLPGTPQLSAAAAQERSLQDASPKCPQNASTAASQEHHLQKEMSSSREKLMQNPSPAVQENPQQNTLQEHQLTAGQEKTRQTASASVSEKKQQIAAHTKQKAAAVVVHLRKPRYKIEVLDLQSETTEDDERT